MKLNIIKSSNNIENLTIHCPECFCIFSGFKNPGKYQVKCELCGNDLNIKIDTIYKIKIIGTISNAPKN